LKVINQYCQWIQPPPTNALVIIERCGRTCYKSEEKTTADSASKFVQTIQNSGHGSVIEHVSASMLFVTDRGVSHEVVRHRIASFSQESTRYCQYGKEKFGGEITVILPVWLTIESSTCLAAWSQAMMDCEKAYIDLLKKGWTAQEARSVLPNSLKTEIVMTANMRSWIHFFNLRCSTKAHPQIRDLALQALAMFNQAVPVLFDSLASQFLTKTPQTEAH
jgi:thymidylate synthase (FAD)